MATTQNTYTANGSTTNFSFTFPYLNTADVKVKINGTTQNTTEYTLANATTVQMNIAPSNGATVMIFRDTNNDSKKATFYPGSAIKAEDLNNDFDQILYTAQEIDNNAMTTLGDDAMQGDLDLGSNKLTNVGTPTAGTDGVNKTYVDTNTWDTGTETYASGETWTGNNTTIATSGAIDARIDTKVDTALSSDVLAGTDLSKSAAGGQVTINHNVTGANSTVNNSNGNVLQDITITAQGHVTSVGSTDLDGRYYTETELDGGQLDDRYYTETELDAGQLDNRYYTETELNAGQLDTRYYTETELNGGQLDNRYYTETEVDANFYKLGSVGEIQSGETWSAADNKIATTAAIDARVIDLVDDVGGFVPIANETSFPNSNPDVNNGSGTLVSIKALSSNITSNGSGVATIANGTLGNSTVTITGLANSTTYAATFGMIVETTSTLNTYTFHRLVPKATEVTTVASNLTNINAVANNETNINAVNSNATNINTVAGNNANVTTVAGISSNVTSVAGNETNINAVNSNSSNINTVAGSISNVNTTAGSIANVNTVASNINSVNDFSDVYRVSSSDPSSHLHTGDLVFNTTSNELRVYNGSAWQGGVTATGNLLPLSGGQMTGNLTFSGSQTVDGRDVSADGTKLDGIESNSTADMTGAEIKSAYEGESNTNAYTDAEKTKLSGIATSADQNVQSDWNASSGDAAILNKPTIPSAYTHPNHTGEVTSSGDGATTIASNVVDEDNLKISNSGTNGQYLQKQSGNTGGLTWADATSTTINSNSANRIITGSNTANELNGESSLTFDGTHLSIANQGKIKFGSTGEISENSANHLQIESTGSGNIQFDANSGMNYFSGDGNFLVENAAHNTARFKVKSNGCELYASGTKRLDVNTGGATITGACTATSFAGVGSSLTALSASELQGALPAISGYNVNSLQASNLWYGTIPNARFPSTLPAVSGANLTNLNANNLTGLLPALDGGNLTNLHAPNLTGTINEARISNLSASKLTGTLPGISGVNLTNLSAANITSGGTLPALNGANLTNLPASPAARDFTPTNTIGSTKPAVSIDSSGNATEVVVAADTVFKNDDTQNSVAWLNNQNTGPTYGNTNTAYCTINGIDYIVSVWVDNGNNDYGWYRCGKIDTTVDSSNRTIVWGTAAAFASQSMPRSGLAICALNNTGRFVIEGGYYSGWNAARYHCATINTGTLALTFQTNGGSGDQLGGGYVYTSQRHTPNWALVCKSDDAAVAVIQEGYYTRPRIGMIIHNGSNFRTSAFEPLTADMKPEGPFTLAIESTGTGQLGVLLCYRANSGSDMYAKHILTPTDANISYNGIQQTWSSGSTNTGLGWYGTEYGINSGRIPGQNSYWVSLVKPSASPWTNQVQVLTYDYGGTTITNRHLTNPSIAGSGWQLDNRLYGFWDYNASKLILHWNKNDSNVQKLETSYGTPGVFGTGFSWSTPVVHNSLNNYGQTSGPAQWGVSRFFDRQPPLQLSNNAGIYLTSGAVNANYGRIYMEFLSVSPKKINNDTFVGFATAASGGGSVNVALPGNTITSPLNGATLTTGKIHYLDMNSGQTAPTLTTTQTATGKAVGVALSSSVLLIQ